MRLQLPRSFPGLLVALLPISTALGFAAQLLVTPKYVSTATIEIEGWNNDQGAGVRHFLKEKDEITSRQSLSSLIDNPDFQLYERERSRRSMDDAIESMRSNLEIQITDYGTARITFTYRDRKKAPQVVQAIVTRFIDRNVEHRRYSDYRKPDRLAALESRLAELEKHLGIPPPGDSDRGADREVDELADALNLAVIDTPSRPQEPVYPDPFWFSAAGCLTGFLAAAALVIKRRRAPSTPFLTQTA